MQVHQLPPSVKVCFGRITLNHGITLSNFIGCLIHYFMLSFIFVTIDSLQPQLLQQKFMIQKNQQIENFRNVIVIGFDILVKIIVAPVFGYIADRRGRKMINMYGIIVIGIAMMLIPYTQQFYQYILLRCFYAQGAIAISVIPLLADYVNHRSRGTTAAILVFMSSVGAVTSAELNFTILSSINNQSKLNYQYGIAAVMVFLIGITYTLFCLKGGNEYYSSKSKDEKTFKEMVVVAKESFKRPQIVSGYIAAFLARSDSILLSLYLVLWVYSFNTADSYDKANTQASALSGIAYAIIMFSCIVYGLLYNRKKVISKKNLMIIMLSLACLGSALISFSSQVHSITTYISLGVLGVGMSGLLTASLYLVNQYSSVEHRAYITGIQTLFGILGIAFQTLVGALLYQFVWKSGPFDYFALICLIGIALTLLVYSKYRETPTKDTLEDSLIETHSQID